MYGVAGGDEQPGSWERWGVQPGLAVLVDAVDCNDVLGEIVANDDNAHGVPLSDELMSPWWEFLPSAGMRLVREGAVPLIR